MEQKISIHDYEELVKQVAEQEQNIQQLMEDQTKLGFQKSENEIVLDEFEFLDNDDVIYQQVGPVLVKREISEAKQNINGRLEFIKDQIQSKQDAIEKAQKDLQASQAKLLAIQSKLK